MDEYRNSCALVLCSVPTCFPMDPIVKQLRSVLEQQETEVVKIYMPWTQGSQVAAWGGRVMGGQMASLMGN